MRKHIISSVLIVAIMSMLVSCGQGTADSSTKVILNTPTECTVQILIDYERNSFAYNDDATIYIDDIEIGCVSVGEIGSFQITTETGQHSIQAKGDTAIRHNNSSAVEFTIDDTTQDVRFELKDDSITGLTISLVPRSDLEQSSIQEDNTTSVGTSASSDLSEIEDLSYYESIIFLNEQMIQALVAESPLDEKTLMESYKSLLAFRMFEATFKDEAYYYYTKDKNAYPPAEEIADECLRIKDEMKLYFDEESVDSLVSSLALRILPLFRHSSPFPFEAYEVLTPFGDPDIEAMWELYFDSEIGGIGVQWASTFDSKAGIDETSTEFEQDTRPLPNDVSAWSGTLGAESWCEISFSYPSVWNDYGFDVIIDHPDLGQDTDLYEMRVVLNDFGTEQPAFHIEFIADSKPYNSSSVDFNTGLNDAIIDRYPYPDPNHKLITTGEDQDIRYWISALYKNNQLGNTQDWRQADWGEVVSPYIESVLDSAFITNASFALG